MYSMLVYIFNECMEKGIFSDKFKEAIVVSIYKKGEKSELINYRPVSIISTVAKVFEYP